MSSKETWNHGIAARRHVIHRGYRMLADAQLTRDDAARERLFLQAYNYLYTYVRPSLDRHEEPQEEIEKLQPGQVPTQRYGGIANYRWARLCWWTEALYRSDLFGADCKPDELEPNELIQDDATQKGHFFAQRSYRKLQVRVHHKLGDTAEVQDGTWANALYDRIYPLVFATAFPVIERLDPIRDAIDDVWHDGRPNDDAERRARRMDTVTLIGQGLHNAAVFAQPRTPIDDQSRDDLLEVIQERRREGHI